MIRITDDVRRIPRVPLLWKRSGSGSTSRFTLHVDSDRPRSALEPLIEHSGVFIGAVANMAARLLWMVDGVEGTGTATPVMGRAGAEGIVRGRFCGAGGWALRVHRGIGPSKCGHARRRKSR